VPGLDEVGGPRSTLRRWDGPTASPHALDTEAQQAIRRGRLRHAVAAPAKRAKAHLDQLVAAVPERNLIGVEPEVLSDRRPRRAAVGLGYRRRDRPPRP